VDDDLEQRKVPRVSCNMQKFTFKKSLNWEKYYISYMVLRPGPLKKYLKYGNT
jgi:hypothetical protein